MFLGSLYAQCPYISKIPENNLVLILISSYPISAPENHLVLILISSYPISAPANLGQARIYGLVLEDEKAVFEIFAPDLKT
jgi:hypothetical protein